MQTRYKGIKSSFITEKSRVQSGVFCRKCKKIARVLDLLKIKSMSNSSQSKKWFSQVLRVRQGLVVEVSPVRHKSPARLQNVFGQ